MNATHQYGHAPSHHGYVDHHGPPSSTGPAYSHYGVQVQPPMLPPAVSSYGHGYYPYGSPAAPQASHFSQPMSLSAMNSGPPPSAPAPPTYENRPMDMTGQVLPPGMKPKITATLWEDEGTVCFQVEVEGICVARRSDNSMINGTKLLNVARMTRGRRDGILKSEKHRKVIKIGPMHLKGVWIPFDRALEFANKEKITEQLYPLFVHNVEHHLHQTQIQQGTTGLTHRRGDSRDVYRASASQTPAIPHSSAMQSPTSLVPTSGRSGMERAHTFPTPPTSASAIGMGSSGGSYEWGSHAMPTHPVAVDGGLNTAKSLPTTPATTPPDNIHMQYPTTQVGYESRVYSAPPNHHSPYTMPPMSQYGYTKAEMAPPMRNNTNDSVLPKEEEEINSSPPYTAEGRSYTFAHPAPPLPDHSQTAPVPEGYKDNSSDRTTPRIISNYATPQNTRAPLTNNVYPLGAPQTPQSYYPPMDKKRHREADDEDPYARENEAKRQKSIHDSGIGRSTPMALGRPQSMMHRH